MTVEKIPQHANSSSPNGYSLHCPYHYPFSLSLALSLSLSFPCSRFLVPFVVSSFCFSSFLFFFLLLFPHFPFLFFSVFVFALFLCPFSFPFSFYFIFFLCPCFSFFFVTLFLFFFFLFLLSLVSCPLCLGPANQQVSFGACRSTRHVAENDGKVAHCSFQLTQTAFSIVLNSPS